MKMMMLVMMILCIKIIMIVSHPQRAGGHESLARDLGEGGISGRRVD